MERWKKALSLLIISCMLITVFIGGTFAVDKPSVYELNTRYTFSVDGIEDSEYVIWGKALAFAVGKADEPCKYLLTDAHAIDLKTAVNQVSNDLIIKLADDGLEVTESQLLEVINEENVESSITVNRKEVSVAPVYSVGTDSSAFVLEAEEEIESAIPAVFTSKIQKDLNVSDFKLNADSEKLYGIAKEDDTLSYVSVVSDNAIVTEVVPSKAVISADSDSFIGKIGAPMLNDDNEVIGIVTYNMASEFTSAVNTQDTVSQLLTLQIISENEVDDGVPSNPFAADADDFSDPDLARIAMIIKYTIYVAVALVIVLIVLLIIHFRRNKGEEEPQEEINEEEIEKKYEERQRELKKRHLERHTGTIPSPNSTAPKIRPAVRQKPSEKALESTQRVPNVPLSDSESKPAESLPDSVTLTVISGKKKGYSVKVTERIVLGRDPQNCKFLFPASDTTISRVHCALTFIPKTGDVVLEDLGSANGTYSASGKRLVPGKKYRVRIGNRFYLGTEENMIEVK